MREQKRDRGIGLKKLALFMMFAFIAVSCGQNNTSGKSKNSSTNDTVVGGYDYSNYPDLPSNWRQVVLNENTCQYGRLAVKQVQINANTSSGIYAGVTPEGDAVFIYNGVAEFHFCKRPDYAQGQAQISNVKLSKSSYCSVGDVNALDVFLPGNYGTYPLAFVPLYQVGSQLCNNGYY